MNASEGLMRIALVVRWIGYALATVLALGAIAAVVFGASDKWATAGIALLGAAFWAVAGWALAWIIEGFAKPKAP